MEKIGDSRNLSTALWMPPAKQHRNGSEPFFLGHIYFCSLAIVNFTYCCREWVVISATPVYRKELFSGFELEGRGGRDILSTNDQNSSHFAKKWSGNNAKREESEKNGQK